MEKALSNEWENEDWISNATLAAEVVKTSFNLTVSCSPMVSTSIFGSSNTMVELDSSDPSAHKYVRLLKGVIQLMVTIPLGTPAMSPPHIHAINTLMNIPVLDTDVWFPNQDYSILKILLDVFEESIKTMAPRKSSDEPDETLYGSPIDQVLIPLCLLLKKLTIIPPARLIIKKRLLPNNLDRTRFLNEGPHVTAAMIRAMTNVSLTQTRDFLGDVVSACFEDNSKMMDLTLVERFVRYIGYGNAAGYLFQKGFSTPESTKGNGLGQGDREDEFPEGIDTMTGKIQEAKVDPFEGMTEEEKNRETERLFVLFDRLNKTGVVQLKRQGD